MKIYLNSDGMREILTHKDLDKMEQNIMMQKLDQIKAGFLQSFGIEGDFRIEQKITSHGPIHVSKSSGGRVWANDRVSWRILPNDARTTAILKAHPGWMSQFL